MNFSKIILQKQNTIPLGIVRHVYKIHFFTKFKNVLFKWGLRINHKYVSENEKFDNIDNMGIH